MIQYIFNFGSTFIYTGDMTLTGTKGHFLER